MENTSLVAESCKSLPLKLHAIEDLNPEDYYYDGGPPNYMWYSRLSGSRGVNELKEAAGQWANAWYIGVALNMTIAFAMIFFEPSEAALQWHLAPLYK